MNNKAQKKNNTNNSNVKGLIVAVLKQNIWLSVGIVCAAILVVSLSLIPPQILKVIVDSYLMKGLEESLLRIAILYFVILIFIGIADFVKEVLLTVAGQKITRSIRSELMLKNEKLPISFFTANGTGSIVSVITNDVEVIQSLFTNGIIGMIIDAFKIIGIVVSIMFFSVRLGILVLVLLPFIYMLTRLFQKRMLKAQVMNRIHIGRVNNHIPESINNIQMIKSYGKEEYMQCKYGDYLKNSYDSIEKINFYDAIFSPIILTIRAIIIVIIVIFSTKGLAVFGLTVGMVAAAIELISNIFTPIENLGMELQSIQEAVAGINRVNALLKETEDISKDATISYNTLKKDTFVIRFENVRFSYDNSDNEVLKGVSFIIKPNENVTFMGRTGVGKSTIFKLILGLHTPDSGHVFVGNTDITRIPNREKRRIFGYVEQNFEFISGTVAEQISMKDCSITRQEIENAAQFVGLNEYILQLDNGYDTFTSEYMFSQGQKQLLSIARAIVSNPPIMLLDEMTANLDMETERKILLVLKEASKDRTLISISHRMSAIMNNERVIEIENGKVI